MNIIEYNSLSSKYQHIPRIKRLQTDIKKKKNRTLCICYEIPHNELCQVSFATVLNFVIYKYLYALQHKLLATVHTL